MGIEKHRSIYYNRYTTIEKYCRSSTIISQQKLDIIVDTAVEVATKDNKEPDVAAREVLQVLDPDPSEEIVDAVIAGTEEKVTQLVKPVLAPEENK